MELSHAAPKNGMAPYSINNLFDDVALKSGRPQKKNAGDFKSQWVHSNRYRNLYLIRIPDCGIQDCQEEKELMFYAAQMNKRIVIVKSFGLEAPNPLKKLIDQLQENPMDLGVPLEHWRYWGDTPPLSVYPQPLKDITEIYAMYEHMFRPDHAINTPCDQLWKDDYGDTNLRRVIIDLNVNSEEIIKDFTTWLDKAKKQFTATPPLSGWWKRTQINWLAALALVDLCIWAKHNNQKLSKNDIFDAITDLSKNTLPSLRKKIITNFTHQEFEKMRAQAKILAKNRQKASPNE